MLTISGDLLARMHAHLEAGYPSEACGILLGDVTFQNGATRTAAKFVKDLVLAPNVWEVESEREGQRNRYLISPEDVARADCEANRQGLDIVGFFHSHPDCPSRPSETDREFAWPVISFVIVSVEKRKAATTNSWVLRDDRSRFDEEIVQVS
ncbi:MAG: M67 family metallopeptidase [Chloroflexi bacterium]|nr:M67 family metallopeptidase [Chloroflexota bacterium]MCL5273444.1 M67 family metallopeptidase [Chloroflexota bacterium]